MPYYRRRSKRSYYRKKRQNKQLRWRLGLTSAAGKRAFYPNRMRLTLKCAGRLDCSATTAGDYHAFNIFNFNDPLDGNSGTTFTGTTNHHPESHADILAAGYDRYLVRNVTYRFDVEFKGTNAADKDFIFMWWFTEDADNVTFTAGSTTTDFWEYARCFPGINWKRFSGTASGGSAYPSAAPVIINVPSCVKMGLALNTKEATTDIGWRDFMGTIADDTSGPTSLNAFLNVAVFTVNGTALSAGDISMDVTTTQGVTIWKERESNDVPVALDDHA